MNTLFSYCSDIHDIVKKIKMVTMEEVMITTN
jgi:hypothetical protein